MATINAAQRLAAQSVTSAASAGDIAAIDSSVIQDIVKKFATIFKVKDVLTDGYNDPDGKDGGDGTYGAGCEITFEGSTTADGSYESAMDLDELQKLVTFIKMHSKDIDFSLNCGENGLFVLVVTGESD